MTHPSYTTRPWQGNISGFSLIELIVILVIIGALAVFASARFDGQDSFDTRGYFDELTSAARYAQRYAVASGCKVQIVITSNSYALTTQNATCGVGTAVQGPDGNAFSSTAPAGVTTTAGIHLFDSRGALESGGGDINVTGGATTLSFTITPETGFVDVP